MALTISSARIISIANSEIIAPNENFTVEFVLTNGSSGPKHYDLDTLWLHCEFPHEFNGTQITAVVTISKLVGLNKSIDIEYNKSEIFTAVMTTTSSDSSIFKDLSDNNLRGMKGLTFSCEYYVITSSSWGKYSSDVSLSNAGAVLTRYNPSITIPALANDQLCKRCDDDGTPTDEGEYALISASASLGNSDGDSLFSASLQVYDESTSPASLYFEIDDTSVSGFTTALKTGFLDSTVLLDELVDASKKLSSDKQYHIYLYYKDSGAYEYAVRDFIMPRVFANIHMAGSGAGVAFGMYCTNTGASAASPTNALFECRYKSKFYDSATFEGGINGVTIYDNSQEVDTGGKWIDDKHIYRAVFSGTATVVDSDRKAKIGTLLKSPTAVLKIYGSANRTGGIFYSIPYINSNVSGSSLSAYVNANGDVYFVVGSGYTINSSNIMNYSIIVEYAASN